MSGLQMPLGSSLGKVWVQDQPIADARNALCQAALDAQVEYLFMLGDDVLPPANTLLILLNKIGRTFLVDDGKAARAQMITGVYWTKTYPPEPYLFNGLLKGTYKDWKAGEFFPIDFAGCDCLLIETELLRQMSFPWFSTDWVWEEGQTSSPIATEDFFFYTKARETVGARVFADTSIQCLHEDRSTGAAYGLSMEMVQAGGIPSVGEDGCLIADLGAGVFTRPELFGPQTRIIRFDSRESVHPDIRCDIANIDPTHFDKFDIVQAHHVLEHFRRVEALRIVTHWVELLKVDGEIQIYVPNLDNAMRSILDPPPGATDIQKLYWWSQIYGDQSEVGPAWQHLNGFTPKKLRNLLSAIPGLVDVKVELVDGDLNLKGTATLKEHVKPFALKEAWDRIKTKENQGETA